jgi:hypothetical protein
MEIVIGKYIGKKKSLIGYAAKTLRIFPVE